LVNINILTKQTGEGNQTNIFIFMMIIIKRDSK